MRGGRGETLSQKCGRQDQGAQSCRVSQPLVISGSPSPAPSNAVKAWSASTGPQASQEEKGGAVGARGGNTPLYPVPRCHTQTYSKTHDTHVHTHAQLCKLTQTVTQSHALRDQRDTYTYTDAYFHKDLTHTLCKLTVSQTHTHSCPFTC